ncbi:hypothetical protein L6452_14710 [Arctium lappa]|uniref:Uncharacterized protein n=1 Tax=Arctium lappa TaxID=4217 RepID=A0ACB9CLR3_ARCLA|nr:hypothetical protein L6452_14710 [Arctium lappa]
MKSDACFSYIFLLLHTVLVNNLTSIVYPHILYNLLVSKNSKCDQYHHTMDHKICKVKGPLCSGDFYIPRCKSGGLDEVGPQRLPNHVTQPAAVPSLLRCHDGLPLLLSEKSHSDPLWHHHHTFTTDIVAFHSTWLLPSPHFQTLHCARVCFCLYGR